MKKIKAMLPDIRGDKWDEFILKTSPNVRELRRGRKADTVLTLDSSLLAHGIAVEFTTGVHGLVVNLWVRTQEFDALPELIRASLPKFHWIFSPSDSGWSRLQKNYQGVTSDTQAPRDATVALAKLGAEPRAS